MSKPPAHLVRPIIYPKPGIDSRQGAAYRTPAELAAMNDPHNSAANQPEEQELRDKLDEGTV